MIDQFSTQPPGQSSGPTEEQRNSSLWITILAGIVLVTIALMVPFVVRFGAAGVIALLVALQVAGILLLLAAAMFTGRSVSLGAFSGRIAAAATFLHASLGDAGFSALLVIGVVALNAASYRLAAWVYRRREF